MTTREYIEVNYKPHMIPNLPAEERLEFMKEGLQLARGRIWGTMLYYRYYRKLKAIAYETPVEHA